jgi:hypothetical protein
MPRRVQGRDGGEVREASAVREPAASDGRAHAVELRTSGLAPFYDGYETEEDRSWALEARGPLDTTKRTNIELAALHQVEKDCDSPADALERGNVETDRIALVLNHQFNRVPGSFGALSRQVGLESPP